MKLNVLFAAMVGLAGLNEQVPDAFIQSDFGPATKNRNRHTGVAKARREKKARKRKSK